MIKNILITGASGLLGQNIADQFNQNGYNVYGTYNHTKINNSNINAIKYNLVNKIVFDINFDMIIHCAANITSENINNLIDDNILATRNVIEFAEISKVSKLIYCSSASIYGDVSDEVTLNSNRINLIDYSMTKFIGEKIVCNAQLPSKYIVRLPRILGKNVNLSSGWIPKVALKMLNNEDIHFYNGGLLFNNLGHTSDLGNFFIYLYEKSVEVAKTMLFATSTSLTIFEILTLLKEQLKSNSILIDEGAKPNLSCFKLCIDEVLQLGYTPLSIEDTIKTFCNDIKS